MSEIEFNYDELKVFAADLGEVPRRAAENVGASLKKTAFDVRDSWRESVRAHRGGGKAAASITFDVTGGMGIRSDAIEAEIGPELGEKGSLRAGGPMVGLLDEGIPGDGNRPAIAPRLYSLAALDANRADFERGLGIAIEDVL